MCYPLSDGCDPVGPGPATLVPIPEGPYDCPGHNPRDPIDPMPFFSRAGSEPAGAVSTSPDARGRPEDSSPSHSNASSQTHHPGSGLDRGARGSGQSPEGFPAAPEVQQGGRLDPPVSSSHAWRTFACAYCGSTLKVWVSCGDRLCPHCRRQVARKAWLRYRDLVRGLNRPKLLTLTLKNRPSLSKSDIDRLRNCFTKLRRRKLFRSVCNGGIYSIEVTNIGNGWHLHMHCLIDAKFIPVSWIARTWKQITGDSWIIDLVPVRRNSWALNYVLSYVNKPPKVDGYEHAYRTIFAGVRLVHTWGSFYNHQPERESPKCPNCGCDTWINLDRGPKHWTEYMLTYVPEPDYPGDPDPPPLDPVVQFVLFGEDSSFPF